MTPKFTAFVRIMCVGFPLTAGGPSIAAPNVVPKLNVRPSCESPARKAVVIHHAKAPEVCLKKEKEAHEILIKHWLRYAKVDKTNCVGKVSYGGPPSYVELLSCLEIREHAQEIRDVHH